MGSLTLFQQTNHDGFPKAAELIEIQGAHALEASDRMLFNHLLQHAHDSGLLGEPDARWELTFATLLRSGSKHESSDRIRQSLKRLRRTEVKVTYQEGKGNWREYDTHLLEFTDTSKSASAMATVRYGIPRDLRDILVRSNRWGRIRCEVSYSMSSKYAIALYEIVCLRKKLDRCVETFPLGKFRELLGVPPSAYKRGDNFLRFVITPALLEVNGLSDMGVKIELVRKHARAPIDSVEVEWWGKEGPEFRAAIEERNRSKVGRKARLKAQTEMKLKGPGRCLFADIERDRVEIMIPAVPSACSAS